MTDELKLVAINAMVTAMDEESLANAALDIGNRIDAKRAALERSLEEDIAVHSAVIGELAHRMHVSGGTAIFSQTAEVEKVVTTKIDHRIDILKGIRGLVPDEDYHKALYEKTITEEKADARKLQALAKKYGGKVKEIVDAGLPRVQVGLPKIIVRPRDAEKNVTDTAAQALAA